MIKKIWKRKEGKSTEFNRRLGHVKSLLLKPETWHHL